MHIEKRETGLNMTQTLKNLIREYYSCEDTARRGIPTVCYFAEKLGMGYEYFENQVFKQTGLSAEDFISSQLAETAKLKLFDTSRSIAFTACELGFKNTNKFARFFKQKTGFTPFRYREIITKKFTGRQ
ncbi:helix-turn-helix domain-containing protein [Flavobacterium hungaricum]|uniref:Helix-turn-helix domain-containing protein n=1 Tax=Flavobacterium hungaricum TaxID=2082725 RepID=A0ABR9TM16_9FLAO|nr:helix-turn-helix domain-containing protein [Flavobacterium hungaricum]MBE8726395.1 helix-turn-helix domain-containing protein [Flavobacterium hungaricum]